MSASPVSAKPPEVIDRDQELRQLTDMWSSERPELLFVFGRPRIGKTFLLSRLAQATGGIFYQAIHRTESAHLAHLTRLVGHRFGDAELRDGEPFAGWDALFGYLTDRASRSPFLIVLDDFPHLLGAAPGLPAVLQEFWDRQWPQTRMKLVLSGSHLVVMRELEAAGHPLHGRRTRRLLLGPFGPRELGAFVPHYSAPDRLLTFGIFGGVPGHLSLLDPNLEVGQNAAALMFDAGGPLADEGRHMLDPFLGATDVHYSMIEAIAIGEHTWKGITGRVGRTGGAALRPMQWLVDMQVVSRRVPITENAPRKSKRVLYRVTDPYVAFWYRFVAPLVTAGRIGLADPRRLWTAAVAPRLDVHMEPVFEDICRHAVRRGLVPLPFTPTRVGEWWDAGAREQVDVVALGDGGEMLVAECRWGEVTGDDLAALERRAELVAAELRGVRRTHLALFSGSGRCDRAVAAAAAEGRVIAVAGRELV